MGLFFDTIVFRIWGLEQFTRDFFPQVEEVDGLKNMNRLIRSTSVPVNLGRLSGLGGKLFSVEEDQFLIWSFFDCGAGEAFGCE